MAKAVWNGTVIAESARYETVEGNIYFPPDAVNHTVLKSSDHTTFCPWKGTASYYTIVVDGQENENAAWYYPDPKPEAANIKNFVAFWQGVEVET